MPLDATEYLLHIYMLSEMIDITIYIIQYLIYLHTQDYIDVLTALFHCEMGKGSPSFLRLLRN